MPRIGINAPFRMRTVHGARHLFREHCGATRNPMAPAAQRALMGKTASEATDRNRCTLQVSARRLATR